MAPYRKALSQHESCGTEQAKGASPGYPNCPQGNITQRAAELHIRTPPNRLVIALYRQALSLHESCGFAAAL